MAPIRMKTRTKGPLSPGTSETGAARLNPVVAAAAKSIEDKYDRPANVKEYFDRTRKYNEGLRAGGEEFRDDSGILRLNLVNKGITDPNTGATILSMMRPELTAVAPRNFGEFMRDVTGAAGDTLGAVGEKVLSGGVTGDLLKFLDDKIRGTGQATGVEDVLNRIRQLQNLGSQYGLDNIQVDPFNLNEGIGYQNQFMFNDTPINYDFNIKPSGDFGFNIGLQY